MRRTYPFSISILFMILCLLGGGVATVAAQSSSGEHAALGTKPPLTVAFQGALAYGPVTTAVNAPGAYGSINPIDYGWGAGLSLEYAVIPEIRAFLDGNFFTYRKQVGVAGQNSSGDWVFEMTGYSTNQLHFSQDAFFDMDATGFRVGMKAGFPAGDLFPWVGAGYGYYSWSASYDTSDRSKSWGGASGYVWGLTYLAGIDWWMSLTGQNDMYVRLYADLTSPAVFPVIDNLFNSGWTWDNSGGNGIMGAYRFGVAVGMPF